MPAPPKATSKRAKSATKAKPAAKAKPARRKTPAKQPTPLAVGLAVAAVERDLEHMPTEVAESAEAATALAMAQRLDSGDGSPSECAKALLQAMSKLRAMAPPEDKKGALHGIKSGRALRLAPGSAAGR